MRWVSEFDPAKTRLAAELARRTTETYPDRVGAWQTLVEAECGLGNFPAAVAALEQAIACIPASAELHLLLAKTLIRTDAFEAARAPLNHALALAPDRADVRALHAEFLAKIGLWDAAASSFDAATGDAPSQSRIVAANARRLEPEALVAYCEAQLVRNPAYTDARYFRALALARLGRDEEARSAMALGQLLCIGELPSPDAYADGAEFRESLAIEIRRNPTLSPDPRGKATKDGLHTRCLRQVDAPAVEALVGEVKHAVDGYVANLAAMDGPLHPDQVDGVRLDIWAVVFGAEGRQVSHRHGGGWISGVYYVAAPRALGQNAYAGSLLVGALDPADGIDPPWGVQAIEPVPGRLVLFPSYVPHATEPSGVDGDRISVAFDVVPV